MMYKKDLSYRDIPYSCETPQEDFFMYGAISNLYATCVSNKNKIVKIRTVGILINNHGSFYIKQMLTTHNPTVAPDKRYCIQVSMAHMSRLVSSLGMPYPVQLFGRLQWCDHPVIFAQLVQPLSVTVAVLLQQTMARVSTLQSHSQSFDSDEPRD